jgi:hypothetical protein
MMPGGRQRTDAMAGVMAMLGHTPEAAQEFFSSGGTTTIDVDGAEVAVNARLQYLLADRVWASGQGSDEGDSLGAALDAAVTTVRNRAPGGVLSARITTQLVALVGGRSGLAEGWDLGDALGRDHSQWQIPTGMRDSVAGILADYMPDVFRVIGNVGGSDPVDDDLTGDQYTSANPWFPSGMPYGAAFTQDCLDEVLRTLGSGDGATDNFNTITTSWAGANQLLLNYKIASDPSDTNQSDGAATFSSSALRFIADKSLQGAADDAEAKRQRAEIINKAISIASAIPALKAPAAFADGGKFAWDQAKSQAVAAAKDAVSDFSGDKSSDFQELLDQAEHSAMQVYANAVLNNGAIPEDVIHDGENRGYIIEGSMPDGKSFVFSKGSEFVDWALQSDVRLTPMQLAVQSGLD